MGLDINIHRALDKLANKEDGRTEAEERDLGEFPLTLLLDLDLTWRQSCRRESG